MSSTDLNGVETSRTSAGSGRQSSGSLQRRTVNPASDVQDGKALEENGIAGSPTTHTSEKPEKPTTAASLRNLVTTNWYFNIFLIFVPIGIALGAINKTGDVSIFIINFLAIIPLAKVLNFATEELAVALGPTIGGLLNVTLGNAVELIVGIIALKEGLVTVVQASVLGSILSNLLFVLGFCFLCGGIYHKEQQFSIGAANTSASLLSLTVLSFLLPGAFHAQLDALNKTDLSEITSLSRAVAILLLVVYGLYILFQFRTHAYLFKPVVDEEEEYNTLTLPIAFMALIGATILIGVCAEFLVSSIQGLATAWNLTETFIGLIILPIVGNAAEHVTAVTVAMKNKMDLALSVALGSSLQIAILVTPIFVLIGWALGVNLTLDFPIFQTAVVFVTVFIVTQLVNDGKSNWLEGVLLLVAYLIIAVSFFYIPA
ncbi:hypothetical protein SmJEL517_g01191 [Synchytrium microbalum]|uniref:Vacuolar calcium ion transporter n=1 Tax=Synchytrium microbalum TaxID=1806994 RepID=A0A507CGD4_9FUNG|nr:uncharacterized protein SmJEL517_g01191 [Synchytrium microbalum]TPX36675.1 hypothetical protein SmJEL517_g01191 [Synchytrium microbalum]